MIDYDPGTWGMTVVCKLRGSVWPKAAVWAFPPSIVAVFLHMYWHGEGGKGNDNLEMEGISAMWSGYTFVLGFLIVFRNNQAYSRFWEGATLIHQIRGEWFNAASNLLAWCTEDPKKSEEVHRFRQITLRLMSMLYCNALQQVAADTNNSFDVIGVSDFSQECLDHLATSPDRVETVLHWVQRLIIVAVRNGVLEVPAPIVTRAYQELSRGVVNLNNVRKIKEVKFPFPYAQMITTMLLVHWIVTPIMASQVIVKPWWAAIMTFSVTCAFWALFYIALEIDQPFGDDANDLDLHAMQSEFNDSLIFLMEKLSFKIPEVHLRSKSFKLQRLNSDLKIDNPSAGQDIVLRDTAEAEAIVETKMDNSARPALFRHRTMGSLGGSLEGLQKISASPHPDLKIEGVTKSLGFRVDQPQEPAKLEQALAKLEPGLPQDDLHELLLLALASTSDDDRSFPMMSPASTGSSRLPNLVEEFEDLEESPRDHLTMEALVARIQRMQLPPPEVSAARSRKDRLLALESSLQRLRLALSQSPESPVSPLSPLSPGMRAEAFRIPVRAKVLRARSPSSPEPVVLATDMC